MNQTVSLLDALGQQLSVDPYSKISPTAVEGVRYFRATAPTGRQPLLYNAGILILGQGSKIIYMGERSYTYDANNYLLLTAPLPLECETFASPQQPLQGLAIDINLAVLYEIVSAFASTNQPIAHDDHAPAIAASSLGPQMNDAVARLLQSLLDPLASQVLGQALVSEIIFRALQGEQGASLFALARNSGQHARLASVLRRFHSDFERPLVVEDVAREAGLSTSAFHRAFKQMTADSPLQYLKKIRLSRARDMLALEDERVSVAASRVGYKSASQFSREFKRFFGVAPVNVRRE